MPFSTGFQVLAEIVEQFLLVELHVSLNRRHQGIAKRLPFGSYKLLNLNGLARYARACKLPSARDGGGLAAKGAWTAGQFTSKN